MAKIKITKHGETRIQDSSDLGSCDLKGHDQNGSMHKVIYMWYSIYFLLNSEKQLLIHMIFCPKKTLLSVVFPYYYKYYRSIFLFRNLDWVLFSINIK